MKHLYQDNIQQCLQTKDKVVFRNSTGYHNTCSVCKQPIPPGLLLTNICIICLTRPKPLK